MKVVTSHTMQDLDKQAIEKFGVSGLDLMERAGRNCVDIILSRFGYLGRAAIISGKGNNGGDGYVIARLLQEAGWHISVFALAERCKIRGDAAVNLDKLLQKSVVFCSHEDQLSEEFSNEIYQADIIVDAMLGTGLENNITGVYREAIKIINASGLPVMSVDIPTGVHGTSGRILAEAVRASITVTFAFAKLGHILYPGTEYTGELIITDIGIPPKLLEAAQGYFFLNENNIINILRQRDRLAHKGNFGHCLIIGGSTGKTGAASLSANSAVRAGSGLVTLAVAESLHGILETKTTEVMTVPLPDLNCGFADLNAYQTIEELLPNMDTMAIGPGLGRQPGTIALVQAIVESISIPMVIDADGLYALAENISILHRKKSDNIILTPHPGEMARLLERSVHDVEENRIQSAQEFARNYNVYLVLKGARTIIASPTGTVAINGSGNPGMATGGMGDVLTGIIASLLGQGYSAWDACCLGVFIHGYAADLVAEEQGEIGMCASDVQEMLPYAYNKLTRIKLNADRKAFKTVIRQGDI